MKSAIATKTKILPGQPGKSQICSAQILSACEHCSKGGEHIRPGVHKHQIEPPPFLMLVPHLAVMLTPAYRPRVKQDRPVVRDQNVATGGNSSTARLFSNHTVGHL